MANKISDNFEGVMSKRTDAELVKIVTGPIDDYEPSAFEAAKKEFEKRNLSLETLETVKEDLKQIQQIEEDKADEPLATHWKVLTFIFPGLIQLMFAGTFKADGYDRKAKEFSKWTIYGFGFYVALVILIAILNA
ncbi:MAG: hypothetical protein U0U67_01105 [Chitinophagales bacterium]